MQYEHTLVGIGTKNTIPGDVSRRDSETNALVHRRIVPLQEHHDDGRFAAPFRLKLIICSIGPERLYKYFPVSVFSRVILTAMTPFMSGGHFRQDLAERGLARGTCGR